MKLGSFYATVARIFVTELTVPSELFRPLALLVFATGLLLHPKPGAAQTSPAVLACPEPALAPRIGPMPDRSKAPIEIYAEVFDARKDEAGEAIGSVELFRADQYLSTEVVRYRADDGSVSVPSPLVYRDSQLELAASSGQFDIINERGDFNDLDYGLTGSSARGGAERVSLQGGNESTLFNLWFTTCPGEDPEWVLSA